MCVELVVVVISCLLKFFSLFHFMYFLDIFFMWMSYKSVISFSQEEAITSISVKVQFEVLLVDLNLLQGNPLK